MAIFRGTGGSGDSSTDTTVNTVTQKAAEAAASATAAASSATQAANSAASVNANIVNDTTPQLGGELDGQTNKITNIGDPTSAQDAATKTYVDSQVQASALQNVSEDTTPQLGGNLDTNGNNIVFGNNDQARFGTGGGQGSLVISADSTASTIAESGSGDLTVKADTFKVTNANGLEDMLIATPDAGVALYHNDVKKLETTSGGATVTGILNTSGVASLGNVTTIGNIVITGTVDGRDVATDGTKLDGIEASATADQTAAEIRTLVESASDSNVFTDADHTKLDGIEASADVTDATNVTAAGALMDSEVTNLAQVKAFDSSDYATAAQGTTANSALQNVSEDTTPQLGGNLDTNSHNILIDDAHFIADESGNEQIIFQTTGSAVNQFDITNAATSHGPTLSATGDDTNIDLNITPKGTGVVKIDGSNGVAISSGAISIKNGGTQSYIDLYCESSNAHYARLQSPAHSDFSGNITSTLPNTTGTLVTSNAQRRIEVVSSLPGSPDSNTIYFVT